MAFLAAWLKKMCFIEYLRTTSTSVPRTMRFILPRWKWLHIGSGGISREGDSAEVMRQGEMVYAVGGLKTSTF